MAVQESEWDPIAGGVDTGADVEAKLDSAFDNIDEGLNDVADRANHTGTQEASTISDFSNAVGTVTELTGIVSIEDIASLNADITKMDYLAFDCFIQGTFHQYAGGTAISPTIGAGDSSTWVGFNGSVLVYSEEAFTTTQLLTILPIARMQTVQGQSGPSSELQAPVHLTYSIGQDGYTDREWIQNCIGALYADGGTFEENSGNPLQVDQLEGSFHNAQRKHTDISAASNIEASALYSVSSVPTLHTRATLIVPKFYDNGTDIVALSANKFVSHTLLRSPKAEDLFILVYGTQEYDSRSQAAKAQVDYSVFQSQALSGLFKVATFVVKGDSTNIEAIQDKRPNIILENESTDQGDLPPSYASEYLTSSAETTITSDGVFVKAAGTTTEVATSADFTAVGNNRFLYTGTEKRRFKIEVVCSMTSVGNNQTVRGRFAIDGTTVAHSEQEAVGVGTRVGSMALSSMPEINENEYVEFWIANIGATSNITVDYMNFNLISVD